MKFRVVVVVLLAVAISMYAPSKDVSAGETVASWYGSELAGSPMANSVPFDPAGYTVAHKDLPLGTIVLVCDEACVTAEVTDRGPYVGNREFDLSERVAWDTGLWWDGVGVVYVEVLYVPYY